MGTPAFTHTGAFSVGLIQGQVRFPSDGYSAMSLSLA